MLRIRSREYKVMLDHRMLADQKSAAESFCADVHNLVRILPQIKCKGQFTDLEERQIIFLDTMDKSIYLNGLIFRQRTGVRDGQTEFTLKCRSPDRYVASGAKVAAARGLKSKTKFDEDIAAPFLSRFSHSTTAVGTSKPAKDLKQAARMFPALSKLRRDGEVCSDRLEIWPVRAQAAFERVHTGPIVNFGSTEAEIALILWSDGPKGRPLVAEFSFRYRCNGEDVPPEVAERAMTFFSELQLLDWCVPEARTKTQFVYAKS